MSKIMYVINGVLIFVLFGYYFGLFVAFVAELAYLTFLLLLRTGLRRLVHGRNQKFDQALVLRMLFFEPMILSFALIMIVFFLDLLGEMVALELPTPSFLAILPIVRIVESNETVWPFQFDQSVLAFLVTLMSVVVLFRCFWILVQRGLITCVVPFTDFESGSTTEKARGVILYLAFSFMLLFTTELDSVLGFGLCSENVVKCNYIFFAVVFICGLFLAMTLASLSILFAACIKLFGGLQGDPMQPD